MPWLKLLHVAAVALWCGALLYLLGALMAAGVEAQRVQRRLLRLLYTHAATPAALVAIASGTLIFLWQWPLAPWLIAKLGVVAGVVLLHAALGMPVLRGERADGPLRCRGCVALLGALLAGLATTAWLVLAKPAA